MKIAIVKLSALGDIVHAMVVLQFIKKFNRNIIIDWVVDEKFKDLLKLNPYINEVHSINLSNIKKKKSFFLLIKELKRFQKFSSYDLVIDMQGLIKSAIIANLIPSKKTIGFDKFSSREKLSSFFYNKTFSYDYDKNVILRNISLIEFALGFKIEERHIHHKARFLFSNIKNLDIHFAKTKKNILLIPGASHVTKRYSVSKLAEITKKLSANFYIIWGNEEEKSLALKIKDLSPEINICKKLMLDELICLITKVDLVIGPDTGPTHMAWALNKPSITLFGPTPGYRNVYETSINKILESNSTVNPLKINKKDHSIDEIKAEDIAQLAQKILFS